MIDIPKLEQSYQIFHDYTDQEMNQYYNYYFATVSVCNSGIVENIYPSFECKDPHAKNIYGEIANKYLGYFDFDGINVSFTDNTYSTIKIFASEHIASESAKQAYINQVRDKIEMLGMPADLFTYQVVDMVSLNFETR